MDKDTVNSMTEDNIGEQYFELIRKSNSWVKYTYDAKKKAIEKNITFRMKILNSPIILNIPSQDNTRYTYIKNFEDHNISNNLVLDMIIRNQEFQNYLYHVELNRVNVEKKDPYLQNQHYKKLQQDVLEKFGFNIKESLTLMSHHPYINENITEYVSGLGNEGLILNPPFISDIKDGLLRVIEFYLQNKKLYMLILNDYEVTDKYTLNDIQNDNIENDEEKKRLYVKIINPLDYTDVYLLASVYLRDITKHNLVNNLLYKLPHTQIHLVDKIDNDFLKTNLPFLCIPIIIFGKEKKISLLEESFPIEFLDKNFIKSIADDDLINVPTKDSKYLSPLPNLKFNTSRNVNISINLDLPDEELMAKIVNLRLGKNIKSFAEVFNKEVENIKNPKNLNAISKSTKRRNRDYANAFFIYDLYKIIGKEFSKKELELKQEAEIKKNKIRESVQYGKISQKHEYEKIEVKLKNNLRLFSKTALDQEIQKITGLEISKIRKLHALLKSYIDEYKFKNIILGK